MGELIRVRRVVVDKPLVPVSVRRFRIVVVGSIESQGQEIPAGS
jgi:hypothetical protein